MASSQISPRFVIFVVVSLLTHLMDVAASGLFCHVMLQQDNLKTPWFSISTGLLVIPLVAVQLISAVYLLRRKGETSTSLDVTLTAILHVLQLGFISRHFAILQESSISSKKHEIVEMITLRIIFSLTSGLPLLLIKSHTIFRDDHQASWDWVLYLTSIASLLAITWSLTTFRRRLSGASIDSLLLSFPGTILKILWRAGELATRVIALSLFASIYSFWFFLVIGLHWFAMFVCVCVPAITPLDLRSNSFIHRAFYTLAASFTYLFVFINTTRENTVFRYTFYYVILFLENTTLVTVWFVQASSDERDRNVTFVYLAAVAFLVSMLAMIFYYKFFHIDTPKEDAIDPCSSPRCASCKSAIPNGHPPIPPRPGSSGHWLGQYHTSIYCGQHCKHNGQDSLLDSTSERNSILTVTSSQARLQQKLTTIEGVRGRHLDSSTSEHYNSSSNSKHRKKNKKKKDCEKQPTPSGGNVSEDSGSQKQPVWLPSGDSNFANQLLTYGLQTFDTADTADDELSSVATNAKDVRYKREISSREVSSVHKPMDKGVWSSPRRGDDRHWYSDGYSTDRTLDWPNMPVSSIQRNVFHSDTDTEGNHFHCQCHQCFHGDSEVSSIMRTIDGASEPVTEEGQSPDMSPQDCKSGDHRRHHHSHHDHRHHHPSHQHHHNDHRAQYRHHRHSRNLDLNSEITDIVTGFPVKDSSKSNKVHVESHIPGSKRSHLVSSPASDPSHGPTSKRRGSPKRRVHGSAHHDRLLSNQSTPKSRVHSTTDSRMKESERIATELLKKSLTAKKSDSSSNNNNNNSADPRFNVRVMVTEATESSGNKINDENMHSNATLVKRPDDNRSRATLVKMLVDKGQLDDWKCEKKEIGGVTENETDVDGYVLPSVDTQGKSNVVSLSQTDIPDKRPSVGQIDQPSKSSEVQNNSDGNKPNSDSSDGKGEVIYENIWQVKEGDKTKKVISGITNRSFMPDEPFKILSSPPPSTGRDVWYMCSESEDSALPPELLSSSVDGFTASENGSDVSTEIVI